MEKSNPYTHPRLGKSKNKQQLLVDFTIPNNTRTRDEGQLESFECSIS